MASFRIGIDLGTTNCALASVPCDSTSGHSEVLAISQPETAHSATSQRTLPSFLYLAPDKNGEWMAGRFARTRAAEVPGHPAQAALVTVMEQAIRQTPDQWLAFWQVLEGSA
jgi:molecular chaperone DnaK (HSP70)